MKAYLTSLSPFLLSFYLYVSLFFSSGAAFHQLLIFLSFFPGVAFHQPLISLSFWIRLQIISCSLVFLMVSQRTKWSLSSYFSGGLLIFLYEQPWGRQFTLYITDTSVFLGISWLIFPLFRFDLSAALYHMGFLSNQHSNRSLAARGCLPVHTPILGKLDRQSVSMQPLTQIQLFSLLIYICCFVRGTKKWEGEKKKKSIFMSKIWIWRSSGSKFITVPYFFFIWLDSEISMVSKLFDLI